jgi:hypothetical protein
MSRRRRTYPSPSAPAPAPTRVGVGRPVNRPPSYTEGAPLALAEIPPPRTQELALIRPGINSYLRTYRLGECSVIVTKEYGRWHLSIAHAARLPTWDEVAEARYRIVPDGVTMAMLLPPKAEYVNLHPNCMQMVEVTPPEVLGDRV